MIFQENELIDLTSGALFIQGEAIGTREKNYMVGLPLQLVPGSMRISGFDG